MARELSNTNTRLVIKGDVDEPSTCSVETRVENDDLHESPQAHEISSPDFNQTVTALCSGSISTVKTAEGIS